MGDNLPLMVERRLPDLDGTEDGRTVFTHDGAVRVDVEVVRNSSARQLGGSAKIPNLLVKSDGVRGAALLWMKQSKLPWRFLKACVERESM